MEESKLNEKGSVELSQEIKLSLDLIQDATLVHVHGHDNNYNNNILPFSQLNIASPHMPPHTYFPDSDNNNNDDDDDDDDNDDLDESDYDDQIDYDFVNDDDYDDSDIDDNDDDSNEKIKLEVFNRPPSRLGRPLSNPYKSRRIPKKNGPSVDRIKMENDFLKIQNKQLAQELEQCRLTIQALRSIVGQKDLALQNSSSENQKAVLQIRVLEALVLSKHSKDGSIIVRSGGCGGGISIINSNNNNNNNNVINLDNINININGNNNNNNNNSINLTEKEPPLKRKDIIPRKPVPQESDSPLVGLPQQVQQQQQQQQQNILTQPPILQTVTDNLVSDDENLIPPPLPPKRANRRNHIRRWSMDFGTNNSLGQDDDDEGVELINMSSCSDNSNITHNISSSDDNTIVSSSDVPSSSMTLTSTNNDLHRNIPRLLKRRTGDIIQSLSACRSSGKNGYEPSPPSTPSERNSDEVNDVNESVLSEKSSKKKIQSKFRKIFSR